MKKTKWVIHGWFGPIEEPVDGIKVDNDLIIVPGRKYIIVARKRSDGKWYWVQLQRV